MITEKMRVATEDALGRRPPDEEIEAAVDRHKGTAPKVLRQTLKTKLAAFDHAGGRGVELADEIDALTTALVCRKCPQAVIPAECHSDDGHVEVDFDAEPYFRQADDLEIVQLALCGWGGDYPADWVADHFRDDNPEVKRMFEYIEIHGEQGFECHVEEAGAVAWIKANRPDLIPFTDSDYDGPAPRPLTVTVPDAGTGLRLEAVAGPVAD